MAVKNIQPVLSDHQIFLKYLLEKSKDSYFTLLMEIGLYNISAKKTRICKRSQAIVETSTLQSFYLVK